MHLLLLESDKNLCVFLGKSLTQEGYSIFSLSEKTEVETLLLQKNAPHPYVILLDSRLDREESHPLVHRLKDKWAETPILVLSKETHPHIKSTFLDEGADDCMSQPFALEELTARIRVLRRRFKSHTGHQIQFGNTHMDYFQQSVFVNRQRVLLSRKEYEVLRLFMEHPQRVYSKFQILDQVWNVHCDVESNVVEVTIKNVRKKLYEKGADLRIESRRHFGYWVEVPIKAHA